MNRLFIAPFIFSVAVCIFGISGVHAQALPSEVSGQKLPTLADVVSEVEHGIVNIASMRKEKSWRSTLPETFFRNFEEDSLFNEFFVFEEQAPVYSAYHQGSGVVFEVDDSHTYILTNHHILAPEGITKVTLTDGRTFTAETVGSDPEMDLALLQIPAVKLKPVELGDSDLLRVGDFVLAFGNNYGLSSTVTSGIVSALGRSGLPMDQYQNFIQTDAAINQGSSGGALVNLDGKVIGINTAIMSPAGGNIGIGFAIPINAAKSIAHQLSTYGRVERGFLGIQFQELTHDMAFAYGVAPRDGVLITKVFADSAAADAGLQQGDLLTHVNNSEVFDGASLRTQIALVRVGEDVTVGFSRDGERHEGIGIIQKTYPKEVSGNLITDHLSGAEFQNDQRQAAEGPEKIVVVSDVIEDSKAWNAGIREGDVIFKVNQTRVENVEALESIINHNLGNLVIEIKRDDGHLFLVLS